MKKPCTACEKLKPITEFPIYKQPNYRRGQCKQCHNRAHLLRVYGNPKEKEKKRIRDRNWRAKNPEAVRTYRARQAPAQHRLHILRKELLTDGYIRNRLGVKVTTRLPTELIEAKRLQIQIIRLLKEEGYEKRNRTSGRFS